MIELIQLIAGIKAFYQKSENRDRGVRVNFLLVFHLNLDLKHSVDAEMSLEAIGIKRFKRFGV